MRLNDPYDEDFAVAEDRLLDFKGDLINHPAKQHNIFENAGVFELEVSKEKYDAAIISIMAANQNFVTDDEDEDVCANPDDGELESTRDNNYTQTGIFDLPACFGKELLQRAVTDSGAKSKVAMKCGDMFLGGFKNKQDQIFKASTAQAGQQRGLTIKFLSKVWRISLDKATHTLQVTTWLNKQDAHSGFPRHFSDNDQMLRYKRINHLFYIDTFHNKVRGKIGSTMMHLSVSDNVCVKVCGMK
jgi:hypothetical protein